MNSAIDLSNLRDTIEAMNKNNQIGALRIFTKHGIKINENKYGIHINLSELSDTVIDNLVKYIEYIQKQEETINDGEKQKDECKNMIGPDRSVVSTSLPSYYSDVWG